MNPQETSIHPREIAARLNICLPTAYKMLKDGTIPALRTPGGGKWIIGRRCYEEWEARIGKGAVESVHGQ